MLMQKQIVVKVISDLNSCRSIWNTYSRMETIWDLWEIRKLLIDVYKFPLHFVTGFKGKSIVGVLPLWYNKILNQYEWISDGWTEENYAFGNDPEIIGELISKIEQKLVLEAIHPKDVYLFDKKNIQKDSDHYALDLNHVGGSWEGYLLSLPGKKRQNINRDIRSVFSKKPIVKYDETKNLKDMFDLSVHRMRQKTKKYDDEDESIYESKESNIYKEFINQLWINRGDKYNARIISVEIGGEIVSCDFNLVYKNKYYPLHSGINIDIISGIGSFSNMLDIKDAIDNKCNYVDFCMEDHHWKSSWFKSDPMYKIEI